MRFGLGNGMSHVIRLKSKARMGLDITDLYINLGLDITGLYISPPPPSDSCSALGDESRNPRDHSYPGSYIGGYWTV